MPETPEVMPSEIAICARVATERKAAKFSQNALADAIGVSRDQIASIEIHRTELRFRIGWNICKALNLNQWYVATGQGPKHPFHDFDPHAVAGRVIKDTASFGAVCCRRLAPELKRLTTSLSSDNSNHMPALWPKLKKRLQNATQKPGEKSKLAEFLGVELIRVSQWLSDSKKTTREPGAEYALQMLRWVEQQERK